MKMLSKAAARLARNQITEAYETGRNTALETALDALDRARREDLAAIIIRLEEVGDEISKHLTDEDPVRAYQLAQQVAREIVESRIP
jgi:hypothetical protein